MWSRMLTRFVSYLLRNSKLSDEDMNRLALCTLDVLGALPLSDTISLSDEGNILIRGKELDMEMATKLRNSATVATDNYALKLIFEQITYEAVKLGVHKVETERQLIFARAAIWGNQQVIRYLKLLSGTSTGTLPEE